MDRSVYVVEAEIQRSHWWFAGRRRLFARELLKAGAERQGSVLDIGSGTGSNLRMLRDLGFAGVVGLDNNEEAVRFCAEMGLGEVRLGDICALPFANSSFDLILATDVIEHVEDERLALREIARVLRPGGKVLITVPAFDILWGLQDRVAHHFRRYRLRPLRGQIEQAGLRLLQMFYFNYLLFFPIWLARRTIDRLHLKIEHEGQLNAPLPNFLFSLIFRFDVWTAPVLHPPVGVSIFGLMTK